MLEHYPLHRCNIFTPRKGWPAGQAGPPTHIDRPVGPRTVRPDPSHVEVVQEERFKLIFDFVNRSPAWTSPFTTHFSPARQNKTRSRTSQGPRPQSSPWAICKISKKKRCWGWVLIPCFSDRWISNGPDHLTIQIQQSRLFSFFFLNLPNLFLNPFFSPINTL